MYTLSKSASTNIMIAHPVREQPLYGVYENYAFVMKNPGNLQDFKLMVEDVSDATYLYQHFNVSGSSISLPVGRYDYKMYTASGASESQIIYTKVLEYGIMVITS